MERVGRSRGAVELHWSIDKRDKKDRERDPEVCLWLGGGWLGKGVGPDSVLETTWLCNDYKMVI